MELLKHLAKHHHDNKRVVQSKVSEDDFSLKKKAEHFDKPKTARSKVIKIPGSSLKHQF